MSEPRVSIIVPVYNDATTVGRALESCLAQTLADVEVIAVDDASTDATPEVLARHAASDPRVRVVRHAKNRQLLEARRTGVGAARAPWVLFLDADDWLDADFARRALDTAARAEADVVCFPILCEYAAGCEPSSEVREGRAGMYAAPDLVADGADVVHTTYRDDRVVWSLCGKLYARTCLLRAFDEIPSRRMFQCEDAYTYFLVAYFAHRLVACSGAPAYHYSMGAGDTRSDAHDLTALEYARVCESGGAAEGVEAFLRTRPDASEYESDVAQLRFRLLADATTRFPRDVAPPDRSKAFHALVTSWPSWEAIGWLAARQWDDPTPCILPAAQDLASSGPVTGRLSVGVLWCSLEDADAADASRLDATVGACVRGNTVVTILTDGEAGLPEGYDPPEGVGRAFLPDVALTTGGRYPERARALHEALVQCGADVLVLVRWARTSLPWDALVARACGVRLVLWPEDVHDLLARGGIPCQRGLPATCALVDVVACSGADAVFWRQFGAPVASRPREATQAWWKGVLSEPGSSGDCPRNGGVPDDACVACCVWDAALDALAERSASERGRERDHEVELARLQSLEDEITRAREETESLRSGLAAVRGSIVFRTGRIITAPLRALRDTIASVSKRRH